LLLTREITRRGTHIGTSLATDSGESVTQTAAHRNSICSCPGHPCERYGTFLSFSPHPAATVRELQPITSSGLILTLSSRLHIGFPNRLFDKTFLCMLQALRRLSCFTYPEAYNGLFVEHGNRLCICGLSLPCQCTVLAIYTDTSNKLLEYKQTGFYRKLIQEMSKFISHLQRTNTFNAST
jgi:hypothetical protein